MLVHFCASSKTRPSSLWIIPHEDHIHTAAGWSQNSAKNCIKKARLAGPCICNYKLNRSSAIKNDLSGSPVLFSPPTFLFLNCDWLLLTSINKANLYKLKTLAWLAGWLALNQNREDLSEPYQKPWGRVQTFDIQLRSRPAGRALSLT